MVEQGDIIKADGIAFPLLVVSKNIFNRSGMAMVCPIKIDGKTNDTLHKQITVGSGNGNLSKIEGDVCCGYIQTLDLQARRHSVNAHLPLKDQLEILDMVQSLFDYI